MGNCSIKGTTTGECHHTIRIMSDNGSILQFKAPKTVGQVLQHHPGYGIFLRGHASSPLAPHETLSYGLFYYLLPLKEEASCNEEEPNKSPCDEYVESLSRGSALEVLPSAKNGVWRVKLLIETKQLEEILSEQVNTEALIEKMRIAAATTASSSASTIAASPTRSTWKVGPWKPPTFLSTLLSPVVYRGGTTATTARVDSNSGSAQEKMIPSRS